MADNSNSRSTAGMQSRECEHCGATFTRPRKISGAQWAGRRFCSKACAGIRRTMSADEILSGYESGLSTFQIADLAGVSGTQVARVVNEVGEIRTASERIRLSHARPEVRAKMAATVRPPCPESVKETLRARVGSKNHNWRSGLTMAGGYMAFSASAANGEHAGRFLHAVIAEWKIGRKLEPGEVVHHKDENKLNNDPSNLQVMSHSAHARLHALQNKLGKSKCQAA